MGPAAGIAAQRPEDRPEEIAMDAVTDALAPIVAPELEAAGPAPRRQTVAVRVGNVTVGGGAAVVVQSMTNTDTADAEGTARQIAQLARAGSEIVRITVDRDEAAAAVPEIKERLLKMGLDTPIVGDFHYNGHLLLSKFPDCAAALDKYRINPGNVGFGQKRDRHFSGTSPSSSTSVSSPSITTP